VTKYDYTAIAVLIALMVLAAAEKFPRDKLLSALGGIVFRFARPSVWGGIAFFFALAIIGLFYVKWSPYYARGSSNFLLAGRVRCAQLASLSPQ